MPLFIPSSVRVYRSWFLGFPPTSTDQTRADLDRRLIALVEAGPNPTPCRRVSVPSPSTFSFLFPHLLWCPHRGRPNCFCLLSSRRLSLQYLPSSDGRSLPTALLELVASNFEYASASLYHCAGKNWSLTPRHCLTDTATVQLKEDCQLATMLPLRTRPQALLCLLLAFQLAVAHDARFGRRQEGDDSPRPTTSNDSGSDPEPTGKSDAETAVASTSGAGKDESESTTATRTTLETTSADETATVTSTLTISTNGALDDSNFLNGKCRRAVVTMLNMPRFLWTAC